MDKSSWDRFQLSCSLWAPTAWPVGCVKRPNVVWIKVKYKIYNVESAQLKGEWQHGFCHISSFSQLSQIFYQTSSFSTQCLLSVNLKRGGWRHTGSLIFIHLLRENSRKQWLTKQCNLLAVLELSVIWFSSADVVCSVASYIQMFTFFSEHSKDSLSILN